MPNAEADDITGASDHLYPGIPYIFSSIYSDGDGSSDLNKLYLMIENPTGTDIIFYAVEGGDATGLSASFESGSVYVVDLSYDRDAGTPGANSITITWNITFDWDWDESSNIRYGVNATDDFGAYCGWDYTAMTVRYENDVHLNDITVTWNSNTINDGDWIGPSDTVTVEGHYYFEDSATAPISGDITVRPYVNGALTGTGVTTDSSGYFTTTFTSGTETYPDYPIYMQATSVPTGGGESAYDDKIEAKLDATKPVVTNPQPTSLKATETITFQVDITDQSGIVDVEDDAQSVYVKWDGEDGSVDDGDWEGWYDMDLTSGNTYVCDYTIPGGTYAPGQSITWKVYVVDIVGNVNWTMPAFTTTLLSSEPVVEDTSIGATNMYAYLQVYEISVDVSDPDVSINGINEFKLVQARIATGGADILVQWTQSSGAFSELGGDSYFDIDASSNVFLAGNMLTVKFNVTFTWTCPEIRNENVYVYVEDDSAANDGFEAPRTNNLNIFATPGCQGLAAEDDTLNPSADAKAVGTIIYNGTAQSIPQSLIANVDVENSGGTLQGSNSSLTSSAFSVAFTTSATTGQYIYHISVNLIGDGGGNVDIQSANGGEFTFEINRIRITDISISNHAHYDGKRYWDNNNGTDDDIRITVTAEWEYGGSPVNSGTMLVGYLGDEDHFGITTVFSGGSAYIDVEEGPSTGAMILRDDITCDANGAAGNEFGDDVTVDPGVNTRDIGWDNKPPGPPASIMVRPDGYTDSGEYDNDTHIFITWTDSIDEGCGLAMVHVGFDDPPVYEIGIGVEEWNGTTGEENETVAIFVSFTDNLGNVRVVNDTIYIDKAPPPVPAPDLEPDYTPGLSNEITWPEVFDAGVGGVEYYVECSDVQNFTHTVGNSGWTSNLDALFTGLADGQTYYYRIKSRDSFLHESDWSLNVSSTQDNSPPSVPEIQPEASTTQGLSNTISWNVSVDTGVEGIEYYVEYSDSEDFNAVLGISGWIPDLNFDFTDLSDGQTYYYRVKARDGFEIVSGWSATVSSTQDNSPPTSLTVESATHPNTESWYNNTSPSFSWNLPYDITGVAGYSYILDGNPVSAPDKTVDTTLRTISFTDKTDGTWYFHLRAVDGFGQWSDPVHFMINIDTIAPTILDESDVSATTGDDFTFSFNISDERSGIAAVTLYWKYDDEANFNEETLAGARGIFSATVTVRGSKLGLLQYYVNVSDNATPPNHQKLPLKGQVNISIMDNDAPDAGEITGDADATTGETITISVEAMDNIGVDCVTIWVDSGSYEMSLAGGTYAYDIETPVDSLDEITYHVVIEDAAGNSLRVPASGTYTVSVRDNDAPQILDVTGDVLDNTREEFTVNVEAVDNIGIAEAWFYIKDETEPIEMSLSRGEVYTVSYSFPDDILDDLQYYIIVEDTSGNSKRTPGEGYYRIFNPDPPQLELGPLPSTLAGTVTITWTAEDPDGDNITIDISYSSDGGETYISLSQGEENDGEFDLDTTSMPDGAYMLEVKAAEHSNTGYEAAETVEITIDNPDDPVIDVEAPTEIVEGGNVVAREEFQINASGSYDPDGTAISYTWTVDGSVESYAPVLDLMELDDGQHNISLIIEDEDGYNSTLSFRAMVKKPVIKVEIIVPEGNITEGEEIEILIAVTNIGGAAITNLPITISVDDVAKLEEVIANLGAGGRREMSAIWTAVKGTHKIKGSAGPAEDEETLVVEPLPEEKKKETGFFETGMFNWCLILLVLLVIGIVLLLFYLKRRKKEVTCVNCKATVKVPKDTIKCPECSLSLYEMMESLPEEETLGLPAHVEKEEGAGELVCPVCGTPCEPGDTVCFSCGADLPFDEDGGPEGEVEESEFSEVGEGMEDMLDFIFHGEEEETDIGEEEFEGETDIGVEEIGEELADEESLSEENEENMMDFIFQGKDAEVEDEPDEEDDEEVEDWSDQVNMDDVDL